MYIIVGLGNPGAEYEKTRHNMGFQVIDKLADKYNIDVTTSKHKGLIGKGVIDGQKVVLLKPQTYMNLSGQSVEDICSYYKIDTTSELIVVYDDISLPCGNLRIRPSGSAGGHNGIKNIIGMLSSQDFWRIKIGVGDKKKGMDLKDHVLGRIPEEEKVIIDEVQEKAVEAIKLMLAGKGDEAMNVYNRKASE
jgi:PTH1 family peptidyl-tRNA hydrolase